MKISRFLIALLFIVLNSSLYGQIYIGKIYLDRKNVFDTTGSDWFFAAPLANSLHVMTREYVINDEILFNEDEELDIELIEETERNLRSMGLFSDVRIEMDSMDDETRDVYVVTQDLWSTTPSVSLRTGGNQREIGARLDELNFVGTGTKIFVESVYRTENNIGMQGEAGIYQRRVFRTPLSFDAKLFGHKYRTEQYLSVKKEYLSMSTPNSYGFNLMNNFGYDFLFRNTDTTRMDYAYERRFTSWYSQAWRRHDRVFATVVADFDRVERGESLLRRAYDNSGKILLGFSSLSQKYLQITRLNTYKVEDLPIGGWGTAVIGFTFPMSSQGDRLFYVGAQGEKSVLIGNFYLFGQVTGASSFGYGRGYYTYQEFYGLSYWHLNSSILLGARLRQQTVWNWDPIRQLILDNEYGLRGYSANNLTGDNRLLSNVELRFFPDIGWWIFDLSGVVFWDAGAVWNQNVMLTKTRFHNSAGLGLRIHNKKAAGAQNIVRIDLAFNFDENRIAEIIISSDQLFSVFGNHFFRLPEIFGLEFDRE